VLDCAHGAAAGVSPQVFTDAGARVTVIGADPDGLNINDGVGSTHLDNLAKAVLEHGADVGIAHDGDADRCLAVDHRGKQVDGDQIMAILAVSMKERGALAEQHAGRHRHEQSRPAAGDGRARDQRLLTTAVGDRYVLEALGEHGLNLGGEQSGPRHHERLRHHRRRHPHRTAPARRDGAPPARASPSCAKIMTVYPQVMVNVRDVDHHRIREDEVIAAEVAAWEAKLGDSGRILLRPSGTEPMVRVMVEAEDLSTAAGSVTELAELVRSRLAL
jgi:phosphoglucosamine mutase